MKLRIKVYLINSEFNLNLKKLAKKEKHDQLAAKFSKALLEFKQTKVYHEILIKYGQTK